ncbi:MAG: hypothetical protein AAB497_02465 [Patescibacteria group bacterium]
MNEEIGEEKVETKQVREIIVPAVSVYQAAKLADELSKCIRMMKHGRWNGVDPSAISLSSLADEIENGKMLEEVMGEVERKVLLTLVERHETSKELAFVLKKSEGAVRMMLARHEISLREQNGDKPKSGG